MNEELPYLLTFIILMFVCIILATIISTSIDAEIAKTCIEAGKEYVDKSCRTSPA